MKIRFILLLSLFFCCSLSAQEVIHHQRGDDLQQYLLDSVKFVAGEYQAGIIKFKDGSFSRGPIDISTVEQRVYFINPEGEIQVLANEDQVDYVSMKGRTFIKSKYGYVELIETEGDVALGAVRRVTFLEAAKKGAYGSTSQTTSVTTVTSFQDAGVMYTLGVNQDTPFLYKVIPYFYKNGKVMLSNKKNLIKGFPDKKAFIETYLKEHSVDFEDLEDLTALFKALETSL